MAVRAYRLVGPDPQVTHWVCDTEAELPAADICHEGDTAYAKDTARIFNRTASAWGGIVSDAVLAIRERRQGDLEDARWALDHVTWYDGSPITPAEKSAAADALIADRISRTRNP